MAGAASGGPPHPFRKGDQFDLPVAGVEYFPDHPLMKQLDDAVANNSLDGVKEVVTRWQNMAEPSPPRGPKNYPDSTLEPALYYAIREKRPEIVDYLLSRGVKMCSLVASEAIQSKCPPAMWQVFLKHGLDINAPLDKGLALPPLGHVLADMDMVRWLLAHGADPNAESHHGLTPLLKAVQTRPLTTVRLLHEAGASLAIAVPFVCSAPAVQDGETEADGAARRLQVLRYLLDNGADPEAPMWVLMKSIADAVHRAHNRYGRGNDFDYGTGLNRAIVKRAETLVEELLRRGARTDSKTMNIASRGETALELAAKYTPRLVPLVAERRKEEELTSGGVAP